jgi:uncharacterized protein (TIGR00730 family)
MAIGSICVYCGSSAGIDPVYAETAQELGRAIALSDHRLIYGGATVGLMGAVADGALAAGGEVTGIITEQLQDLEIGHQGLTELEVLASMHLRKARMAELADGVIVLPGGFGTWEEAFEVLTWNQLGLISTPVAILDVGHFYRPLFELMDGAVEAGLLSPDNRRLAQRAVDPAEAVAIATGPSPEWKPKWVGAEPSP